METSTYMPVAPANYGGMGDFGSGWWIILLFLFAGGGFGWGGNYGGNGAAMNADIQRGFDQNAVMSGLAGLQTSTTAAFGDLNTALCGGFAGVNAAINNGFAQAEIGENARQMTNMQTAFNIQSQMAQFSADNRLGIANLESDIAREACATRSANAANTTAILEKLSQIEMDTLKTQIDAKNDRIVDLQNQLNIAAFNASQASQNTYLRDILVNTTPAARSAS